jgi:hypothetical protein
LTPGLGRQVRRAAPFVVMGLLPVAPLLPIGRTFETIRWLFFPSIGIALLTASALAGFPLRGRWRWLPILLYAALSAAAGRANFAAWRESASLLTGGLDAIAPHVKAMPSEGRAWVLGIPWMVRGAYCANCGVPQLYQRAHERRDAEFLDAASAVGTLDLAIAYDAKEGRAESFVRAGEGVVLGLTAPWSADFAAGSTPADVKLYALPSAQLPKALRLQAGLPGAVALPPMSAPAGSRLRVDLESVPRVADDGASGPRLHITQLTPSGLTRMRRPVGREFPLAPGVELFRLDLTVPYGEAVELSRVKVSVVP